jgi:hypothetical protein
MLQQFLLKKTRNYDLAMQRGLVAATKPVMIADCRLLIKEHVGDDAPRRFPA